MDERDDLLAKARESMEEAEVPERFHRYLIHAHEVRQAADYGSFQEVGRKEAEIQISNAREFLELTTQ